MALLLLQIANAALAAASLGIHFLAPALWDDQAIVFSTLAGTLLACVTAIALGGSLLGSQAIRWRTMLIHLVLTLAFAAAQGWLLYLTGRDMGVVQLLKSRLG